MVKTKLGDYMELELLFKEEKKDTMSEWDKDVPITVRGKVVTAYLMSEIYEPEVYNELCYTLEYTSADYVRLVMNNGGGQLDSMLSIIDAIKRSNATVVAVLSGTVASAATMIALACDEIEVADHTSFMIHSSSGGTTGKHHETKAYMEFSDKNLENIFKDLYKSFLTDDEIAKVLEGKDMWMGKKETLERFANMKGIK
jgi:ATP-dependent protease ClpP protease subunit